MIKNLFLIFLLFFLCSNEIKAQYNFGNFITAGIDTLGDDGYNVIQDHSGNYISCGRFRKIFTNINGGYLAKFDRCGNPIWKKFYDQYSTTNEKFNDLIQLQDKNYLVLGTATTPSSVTSLSNIFLTKVDTNGNTIWNKTIPALDQDYAYQMDFTSDNNIIINGYVEGPSINSTDILLIKTNLNGDLIWHKNIGSPTLYEKYPSLNIINSTTYLLGGSEYNSATSSYDMAIMKIDTVGNILFKKLAGKNGIDETGKTAIKTNDGGYAIGGTVATSNTGWLYKLDSLGVVTWSLVINNYINEIMPLDDSTIIGIANAPYQNNFANKVSGSLFKVTNNGALLWQKFYIPPPSNASGYYFNGFNFASDNGFIITGHENFNSGDFNLILVKTDSLGNDSSSCVIIDNIKENEIVSNALLFPNPNNGNFKVELINSGLQNKDITVTITDVLGKTIYNSVSKLDPDNQIEINNTHLISGVYYISLIQSNTILFQSKLVVH